MFVEYLFEINPINLALFMIALIFVVAKTTGQSSKKEKVTYEEIPQEWKDAPGCSKETGCSISVMSYNIMAYNFTRTEWFPYCNPDYLTPKYRAPRIIAEIEKMMPDVLCLQECDLDLFLEFYKVNLESLGYNCIFKGGNNNRIVINVTCYRRNVLKQEVWEHIDLNEGLDQLDDSFIKHKEATISTLMHIKSRSKVQVVNTHLFWNPEFEYVKYGQLATILQKVRAFNFEDLPVILCGDLNSTPTSNVLKYVYHEKPEFNTNQTRGDLNKNRRFIDQFFETRSLGYKMRSAYDTYKEEGKNWSENHPDFTTYTDEFVGTLDYILYTPNISVSEYLAIPTQHNEVKTQKLPNHRFPSDHFKIGAVFKI